MGSFRRDYISKPIFAWARKAMPAMSDTEREALEAGDVWWDADLFTGNPDWAKLLAIPPAALTAEEQAFLEGPVNELCGMLDDWKISWELRDLPPEVWDFIKTHRFFGMIIPKEFGGLGFSPYAHSEVVRKISKPFARGRRDRHGAELARPRRAADAFRHDRAAAAMAAAPCRRQRNSLLRSDQP